MLWPDVAPPLVSQSSCLAGVWSTGGLGNLAWRPRFARCSPRDPDLRRPRRQDPSVPALRSRRGRAEGISQTCSLDQARRAHPTYLTRRYRQAPTGSWVVTIAITEAMTHNDENVFGSAQEEKDGAERMSQRSRRPALPDSVPREAGYHPPLRGSKRRLMRHQVR